MYYVTDTHPLVWYIAEKLPQRLNKVFLSAENEDSVIYIPSIVLAECLHLKENERIELNFEEVLKKIEISSNFIPVSFNFQIIKLLPEISLNELHDRIIVATTKLLDAKLLTRDRKITESRIVETVW